jgi:2,5-dioxopentanoate dehydrogenase
MNGAASCAASPTASKPSCQSLWSARQRETALPEARLKGESARTINQLRLFAQVVEEGSWVNARIDPAQPDRKPLPRSDIRSMMKPLGPVAVFGASNFPLAFSVAGGDTAAAFAAGNPVIVKAHHAHPGTSEMVGQVIARSVRECGLPPGVFALLFGAGAEIGAALVDHPKVKAVGFTGSLSAGKALMQRAAARPEPIPCFMEMSSVNPLFVLPEAFARALRRLPPASSARSLSASASSAPSRALSICRAMQMPMRSSPKSRRSSKRPRPSPMLTEGISKSYHSGIAAASRTVT